MVSRGDILEKLKWTLLVSKFLLSPLRNSGSDPLDQADQVRIDLEKVKSIPHECLLGGATRWNHPESCRLNGGGTTTSEQLVSASTWSLKGWWKEGGVVGGRCWRVIPICCVVAARTCSVRCGAESER